MFPQTFAFPLLITIYTMVILGGAGSQVGVVLGAIIVSVLLEVLREPGDSRYLFYAAILLGLVAVFRLSVKLVVVLGGTVLLGFVVRALAEAREPSWVEGAPNGGGWLADLIADWTVVPTTLEDWIKPVTYVGLVALLLGLTLVRGWTRVALLIPTLVLAAFVWENVMVVAPDATRYVVLGAILVAVMVVRPNGILGEKRVEIV